MVNLVDSAPDDPDLSNSVIIRQHYAFALNRYVCPLKYVRRYAVGHALHRP